MEKLIGIFLLICSFIFNGAEGAIPKVYDCVLLFNEIDLLKLRLDELEDVVDYFVIVESYKTFSGKDKPSYFKRHEQEFDKYKDKIIYIFLKEHASNDNFWANEYFQRNQVLRGLKNADPSDIVICSDVDEVPRREIVRSLRTDEHLRSDKPSIYYLFMDYFVYKFNNKVSHAWGGPFITTVKTLRANSPWKFRRSNQGCVVKQIQNAGWHFSWMGNPVECLDKLKAFSHAKDPFVKNDKIMLDYFEREDFSFAGSKASFTPVPIDHTFPKYLRNNIEYFKNKNLICYE